VAAALVFVSISGGLIGAALLAAAGQGVVPVVAGYVLAGSCAALALVMRVLMLPDPTDPAAPVA
jgi:uncharacterized membrane protein